MTETKSSMVGKFLVHKTKRILVHVDTAYIGVSNNLLLSVLDDGRRHLIDWATEGCEWEEFDPCAVIAA